MFRARDCDETPDPVETHARCCMCGERFELDDLRTYDGARWCEPCATAEGIANAMLDAEQD
jgi:formylmethanofuran dehydrogenase subunit E